MRNLKKILALVLALVMSLSLVTVSNASFADAEKINGDYAEAATVLAELGVLQGLPTYDGTGSVNFAPTTPVTRAQMAAFIYRVVTGDVTGKQAAIYAGGNTFSDVAADHWAIGQIGFCANGGYILGDSGLTGTFRPDDTVTGYEALIMVLRAIGYGEFAKTASGDWRNGAATCAKVLGITDNVVELLSAPATREMVAEVLYRALLINTLNYVSAVHYTYEAPLGYKTFGLKVVEGVVVANEQGHLGEDDELTLDAGHTMLFLGYEENNRGVEVAQTITVKASTGIDELGMRLYFVYKDAKNLKDRDVLYVGGHDMNTVYETTAAASLAGLKASAKAAGAIVNADTVNYVNFDAADIVNNDDGICVEDGNYVKVIDNDDDGYADFMFKTEYVLDEVYRVNKTGKIFFYTGEYVAATDVLVPEYDDVAAGDVILMTKSIDGKVYFDLAETYTGVAHTYSYKNLYLNVDDETFYASGIENDTAYAKALQSVKEKKTYTFYFDVAGNVAAYRLHREESVSNYVLLTEAYNTKIRNEGYVNTLTNIAEVKNQKADVVEMVVANARLSGFFYDWTTVTAQGDNELVTAFPYFDVDGNNVGTQTNVAAYDIDGDLIYLYTAKEEALDEYGNPFEVPFNRIDYIELNAQDVDKADKRLDGIYLGDDVVVNVVKDTEIYIVNYNGRGGIDYRTGYSSIPMIEAAKIDAMYTVATNVDADSGHDAYWVADVIVIELNAALTTAGTDCDTIDLVYYRNLKQTGKVYNLSVIDATAPAVDGEIYVNGNYDANTDWVVPSFYQVWHNETTGMSSVARITANYADYGIYAGTIDRISNISYRGEYIDLTDGTSLPYNVDVFEIKGKYAYETEITESIYKNNNRNDVLHQGNEGDNIIYVVDAKDNLLYILLVTETTQDLFEDIMEVQSPNAGRDLVRALNAVAESEAAVEEAMGLLDNVRAINRADYATTAQYALALLDAALDALDVALAALEALVPADLTAIEKVEVKNVKEMAAAARDKADDVREELNKNDSIVEDAQAGVAANVKNVLWNAIVNTEDADEVYIIGSNVTYIADSNINTVLNIMADLWSTNDVTVTARDVVADMVDEVEGWVISSIDELDAKVARYFGNLADGFVYECRTANATNAN